MVMCSKSQDEQGVPNTSMVFSFVQGVIPNLEQLMETRLFKVKHLGDSRGANWSEL